MKKTIMTLSVAAAMTMFGLSSCGGSKTEDEGQKMEAMDDNADHMDNMETPKEEKMEEEGVMVGGAMMVPSKDIVDNAVNSKDHTTLVAAVKAAGLVETLKGEGPFTVFAPTNEAFSMLPKGAVDNLLKPENKSKLTKVLTYHVVAGAYKSSDLKNGQMLKTVEGEDLKITEKNGVWMVNGAKIAIADIISSNGVTYVIDQVLMPKKM